MPTLLSIEALEADRLYVQRQLADLRESSWGTARLMWENRLAEIEKQIADLAATKSNYASVALVFDGLPVIGANDIRLDFAADALDSYQKLVTLSLASHLSDDLPKRGPLPGSERSRLFIRDIARGSMGFILEELAADQAEMLPSPLKVAVEDSTQLLDTLTSASEEAFEAALERAQPRMVAAVQRFARALHEAGASTRILGDEHRVTLSVDDVNRLSKRLGDVEVTETSETVDGILLGILPESQQFELKVQGDEELIIRGTVSDDLALKYTADAAFKERLLLRLVRGHIKHTRTMRNGRLVKEHRVLEFVEPLSGS
jgi:hypothetical protein